MDSSNVCRHSKSRCCRSRRVSDISSFDNALRSIESIPLSRVAGRLVRVNCILLESVGCPLVTGHLCLVESANHTLID
ncbi:hypothetical protein JRD59_24460, partial [Citrobacter freundii]|nr:hypothetical protein [Citrobacter freundii]